MPKFIKILTKIFILSWISTAYGNFDDDSLPSVELHFENLPVKKTFNVNKDPDLHKLSNSKHKPHNNSKDSTSHNYIKNTHEANQKEANIPASPKNELNKSNLDKGPTLPENKPVQDNKPVITKPDVNNPPPLAIPVENKTQVNKEKEANIPASPKNESNKSNLDKGPTLPENKPVQDDKPVITKPDVNNPPPLAIPVENKTQVNKEKEANIPASPKNESNKSNLDKGPTLPENKPVQDDKPVITKPDVNNLLPITTPIENKGLIDNEKKVTNEQPTQPELPPLPFELQENNPQHLGTKSSLAPSSQAKEDIKNKAQDTPLGTPQDQPNNLVASIIFQNNDNDIKTIDKSTLDNAIKSLLNNNKKIKITAYNSTNIPETLQITSLQRLISIKKYLSNNNIDDSRISTSIDSKNSSNINPNRIDILYTD